MKYFTLSARKHLKRAIEHVGTQTSLALYLSQELGWTIRQCGVRKWLVESHKVPSYACKPIEAITNGLVLKHQLRPDLWDAPKNSDPVSVGKESLKGEA